MKKNGYENSTHPVANPSVNQCPQDNKSLGVQCLLHTLCNLRCKFCFETKEDGIREVSTINVDYIKNLPNEITNSMVPIMNKHGIKKIATYTMGGELFYDNMDDNILDIYKEFAYNLHTNIKKEIPDAIHYSYFFSNGMFKNHKRIEDFLKQVKCRLILSYDPVDRFESQDQKEMWYNTFKYFSSRPEFDVVVTTVLTKRTIDAYIAGDETFEKLGPNLFVDSHDYAPRLDYHDYLPSDDDLFNFYKWALDNGKFNISHVNDIITHSPLCNQGFFYIFGESFSKEYQRSYISDCMEELPHGREYYFGKYAKHMEGMTNCLDTHVIGLQKRGCLMCEYYNECPKMCWKQILFDKYEISECPTRRIYKYLEQTPEILNRYNKWREEHERNWHSL